MDTNGAEWGSLDDVTVNYTTNNITVNIVNYSLIANHSYNSDIANFSWYSNHSNNCDIWGEYNNFLDIPSQGNYSNHSKYILDNFKEDFRSTYNESYDINIDEDLMLWMPFQAGNPLKDYSGNNHPVIS